MGKKCCVPFCRSGYDKTTAEKSRGPSASSSSSDKSLQNKSGNSAQWGDGDSFSSLVEFRQTTSRSASSTTARGPCTPSSTLPTTASRSSWRPRRRSSSRGGAVACIQRGPLDSVTETPGRQCRWKTNSGVASGETPSRDERNWVAMTLANEYR